jgi:hypothetical protein
MIFSLAAHLPRTIGSVACGVWVETKIEIEIGVQANASFTSDYVFASLSHITEFIVFTNAYQHS